VVVENIASALALGARGLRGILRLQRQQSGLDRLHAIACLGTSAATDSCRRLGYAPHYPLPTDSLMRAGAD